MYSFIQKVGEEFDSKSLIIYPCGMKVLHFGKTTIKAYLLDSQIELENWTSRNQATLFVEHFTNTKNNLFVVPQKNLFVAVCGLL